MTALVIGLFLTGLTVFLSRRTPFLILLVVLMTVAHWESRASVGGTK